MKAVIHYLNKLIDAVGWVCVIAMLLMMGMVFINVFVRYAVVDLFIHFEAYTWYNTYLGWLGGIGMQELEWHFFSIMFLLGLGYTLRENGHVRVDVFYEKFSRRTQAWVNIVGTLIFTIPFSILLVYFGWDYFLGSWASGESKGDPGSLPRLWPIKLVVPVAFVFLILSAITVLLKEILVLINQQEPKP